MEALTIVDPAKARSSTVYGPFTGMILSAAQQTLTAGGALNFMVLVTNVAAADTLGWLTEGLP